MNEQKIMVNKSYYNPMMDYFKFFLSIMVISIHTNALLSISPLLNRIICQGLSRLAVPLFFLISGYFLYRKGENNETLKYYCTRLLKLYIFYFILFLPIIIYLRYIKETGSHNLINFITSILFGSSFQGSWYINASILAPIILFIFRKNNSFIFIICFMSYFFATLASSYNLFSNMSWYNYYLLILHNPYNSFIIALPYFALSRYIASTEKNDLILYKQRYISLFICLILLILEIIICHYHFSDGAPDCYFMLLPSAYFIFIIINNIVFKFEGNVCVPKMMRKLSTLLYIWHFIVLDFINFIIIKKMGITVNSLFLFVITIFTAIIISLTVLKLSKVIKLLNCAY